jgi:small subunit ribosomal protein S17
MIGRVVSTKMQKTVAVLVEGKKTHPLYKKTYVWSKKYLVRDEIGAKLGDVVIVEETKPISKRVHWKINKIVGADVVALGEAAMKQVEEEAIAEVMPAEEEVQNDSENSEVQKSSKSDASGKQSPSESSEKKTRKSKKEAK